MGEPHWPEWTDELVEMTRFSDKSWWDAAHDEIVGGLPSEEMEYLATLGLMELVTWSHRIDREPGYPCAGQRAAHNRYPDVVPEDDGSEGPRLA
ncbi:MAG: hypothetical protein ACC726_08165 [Chloroflexota bacterium]